MTRNNHKVAILMATYNGDRYLHQQIESIVHQSFDDWCLFIHDDGSTDGTRDIIDQYAATYPDRIIHLQYSQQGDVCRNFMTMLNEVESDYYMFSDQDDLWLPKKIEMSYSAMLSLEKKHSGEPLLVATDLRVVDENLNELNPSLWAIAGIYPQYIRTFDEMAANTLVSGCTMLFNNALKEVSIPVSPKATMHDAWIACCALRFAGVLACLPEQTILYRQHQNNILGARDAINRTIVDRLRLLLQSWQINKRHYQMLRSLSYGSIFKFLYYKWLYHKRIVNGNSK